MTDTDTLSPPPRDPDQLPGHTTPTWEVELLISGVAVFAMLQLPGWLDDHIFTLLPRFDQSWAGMLTTLFVYLKSTALILALTFMLHLLLRAHWIALVGMHSVFPDGVHWGRVRMGPIRRAFEQQRLGSVTAAIERADNRATVVFAMGVMLGSLLLVISLVVGVAFVGVAALQRATDTSYSPIVPFLIAFGVLLLPFMAAHVLDQRMGNTLPEAGWQRRALAGVFRGYARIGIGRTQYVWLLVSSRVGELRSVFILWLIIFPVMVGAGLTLFTSNSPDWLGNYVAFPHMANGSRVMNAAYYDDQRDLARSGVVPYIQSAIVESPYLQLVVPYQPGRDTAALRQQCAAALDMPEAKARAEQTLDCLGKLHSVTLDGRPVPDLRYETGSDARARRPALVAMIDVRALAPGRHELRVMRAPATAGSKQRRDEISEYVIPFWR